MIIPSEFYDILGKRCRIYRLPIRKINRFLNRTGEIEWNLENAEMKGQDKFRISDKDLVEHLRMRVLAEISTEMWDSSIRMLTFTESECPHAYNLIASGKKIFAPKEG